MDVSIFAKDGSVWHHQGVARVANASAKLAHDRIFVWGIGKPDKPIFSIPVADVLAVDVRG